MKLNRKQKDIILELINIEIENIQFELDKYSQHKYWSDKIKEYKEIREIINKDKDADESIKRSSKGILDDLKGYNPKQNIAVLLDGATEVKLNQNEDKNE